MAGHWHSRYYDDMGDWRKYDNKWDIFFMLLPCLTFFVTVNKKLYDTTNTRRYKRQGRVQFSFMQTDWYNSNSEYVPRAKTLANKTNELCLCVI